MSVMTPDQLRQSSGRQMALQPNDLQRQAVMDQLGTSPAAQPQQPVTAAAGPVANTPGIFARGGQVKQLPGAGTAGKIGDIAGGVGVQIAGQQIGRGAAQAAGNTAVQSGVKSALTSGVGGAAAGMGISMATDFAAQKLRKKEEMPTFGGANGKYLDDNGRRFEDTGGGTASNMVKYAGMASNPALVAATMGIAPAAGALFGLAKAAITRHAPSAYTDFKVEDAADDIKALYRDELGRDASDDEVMTHLKNVGFDPTGGDRWAGEKSTNFIMDQVRASPEAQAFRTRGAVMDGLGAGAAAGEPTATTDLESRANPGAGLGDMTGGNTGVAGGAAGAATPDSSGWDTDGYSAPGYVPAQAGAVPAGWDATKWNDPNHQTPKYGVGRILSNFPPTVDGLKAAMGDIEKAYPGTTFNGKDKISVPGVGTVDVLESAGTGGKAWRWGAEDGGAETKANGAGAPGSIDVSGGAQPGSGPQQDDGLLARLQAELDRILKGSPDRSAIMAQLGSSNG